MKKVILILAVAGIFILTLNSCASSCKGGMCPSWSQINTHHKSDCKEDLRYPKKSKNTASINEFVIRP